MKLRDLGREAAREWFEQILEWSRKRLTFEDNLDCAFVTFEVQTTETEVPHSLGRIPKYIMEVAAYPNGTAGISFTTKPPENDKIYIQRATAGTCTLLLM